VNPSGSVSGVPLAHAVVSTSHEYFHLVDIYVPIGLAVFAIITVAAVFALIMGRRRPPERAARWSEHHVIEGTYAVFLACVVAFLLYETYKTEHKVDTVSLRERPATTINVVASRWEWTFQYPQYGITIHSGTTGDSTFVVPVGVPVRFRLSTLDVIHAFWIPALHYKHDNVPGSVQTITLDFDHIGTYTGQCNVYCGLDHAEMVFNARAVAPARFTVWAQSGAKVGP
jgi:cytochrome c oxidase subunit 2